MALNFQRDAEVVKLYITSKFRINQDISRFIQRADIVEVLAVVWCVTPQVRTNSSLRTQAEFINRLRDGDIWSNVIIIVKQSVNPKYDARGALAAMQVLLLVVTQSLDPRKE